MKKRKSARNSSVNKDDIDAARPSVKRQYTIINPEDEDAICDGICGNFSCYGGNKGQPDLGEDGKPLPLQSGYDIVKINGELYTSKLLNDTLPKKVDDKKETVKLLIDKTGRKKDIAQRYTDKNFNKGYFTKAMWTEMADYYD
eukprot:UN27441